MPKCVIKNKDFRKTFQDIGRENENIKAIGILIEADSLMKLDEDYNRYGYDKERLRLSVLTERVPEQCYDWRLQRKLKRDDRIHKLEFQYGMSIIVDVISGTERISINGRKVTEEDVSNYLYGEHPLNPNSKVLYISENFLSSNLDSSQSLHGQDTKL
jgi:hypothetical protein